MGTLLIAAGFLAGSIPFGVLVARRLGVDIRTRGSGNIGATNVARVLGIVPGVFVLALDAVKGALPVYLSLRAGCSPWVAAATGGAAIAGHCFSPFLGGRGGKGVATALGVFLVLEPLVAGVAIVVFGSVVAMTRVPALGSLAGIAAAAGILVWNHDVPCATLAVATTLLLVYTHRGNLAKLTSDRRSAPPPAP
jgi:glycerol-3-phosphate acyltransferase PlsY